MSGRSSRRYTTLIECGGIFDLCDQANNYLVHKVLVTNIKGSIMEWHLNQRIITNCRTMSLMTIVDLSVVDAQIIWPEKNEFSIPLWKKHRQPKVLYLATTRKKTYPLQKKKNLSWLEKIIITNEHLILELQSTFNYAILHIRIHLVKNCTAVSLFDPNPTKANWAEPAGLSKIFFRDGLLVKPTNSFISVGLITCLSAHSAVASQISRAPRNQSFPTLRITPSLFQVNSSSLDLSQLHPR